MENPCDMLAKQHNISASSGFLFRLVTALMDKHKGLISSIKAQEMARECIEDFLIRALDNNLELYLYGTCEQVLEKLNRQLFNDTSRYFLGNMIWRVLEREFERHPPEVQTQIQKESQNLADQVIRSFERKFIGRENIHYRDLFRIIHKDIDWFREELRK